MGKDRRSQRTQCLRCEQWALEGSELCEECEQNALNELTVVEYLRDRYEDPLDQARADSMVGE